MPWDTQNNTVGFQFGVGELFLTFDMLVLCV